MTYSDGILKAFKFLLEKYSNCFVIGQGLWSPWYVGNTMKELDSLFGKDRIIDTPVSESATTGAAVGAALAGMLPIVVHPRIDFMLYAMDSIVNQAAKWHHMTGGQANVPMTIRAIINRGGEQGAQHSQALHSWFAHIPGLKVVMPYTASDARDLLIASVMDPNPVIYIDDRWLYDEISDEKEIDLSSLDGLSNIKPQVLKRGEDITIVSCGHASKLSFDSANEISTEYNCEVIDLRVLSNIDYSEIVNSILKTKNLLVIDEGWSSCGISAEVIASISENREVIGNVKNISRLTLPSAPAPTSSVLEKEYYLNTDRIKQKIITLLNN